MDTGFCDNLMWLQYSIKKSSLFINVQGYSRKKLNQIWFYHERGELRHQFCFLREGEDFLWHTCVKIWTLITEATGLSGFPASGRTKLFMVLRKGLYCLPSHLSYIYICIKDRFCLMSVLSRRYRVFLLLVTLSQLS